MYVFILSGMALCLVAGLYWMIGKWALLYGIDTKGKRLWVIRLGIAVFAGSLCLIWSVAGLVEVHLIVLCGIYCFPYTEHCKESYEEKKIFCFPQTLPQRDNPNIGHLPDDGLWQS